MSPEHATTDECRVSKTALLPSAEQKCAGNKSDNIQLDLDDSPIVTTLSTDSGLDDCNLHSVDMERGIDLHIGLEEDNIMTKDFFVSEIHSDHKAAYGRAHFDM